MELKVQYSISVTSAFTSFGSVRHFVFRSSVTIFKYLSDQLIKNCLTPKLVQAPILELYLIFFKLSFAIL